MSAHQSPVASIDDVVQLAVESVDFDMTAQHDPDFFVVGHDVVVRSQVLVNRFVDEHQLPVQHLVKQHSFALKVEASVKRLTSESTAARPSVSSIRWRFGSSALCPRLGRFRLRPKSN